MVETDEEDEMIVTDPGEIAFTCPLVVLTPLGLAVVKGVLMEDAAYFVATINDDSDEFFIHIVDCLEYYAC